MATEITSKEELASLTAKLDGKSLDVTEVISDLKSSLSGISNYDGIDVSGAAKTLSSNLSNISTDLENVVTNIKNYVSQLVTQAVVVLFLMKIFFKLMEVENKMQELFGISWNIKVYLMLQQQVF